MNVVDHRVVVDHGDELRPEHIASVAVADVVAAGEAEILLRADERDAGAIPEQLLRAGHGGRLGAVVDHDHMHGPTGAVEPLERFEAAGRHLRLVVLQHDKGKRLLGIASGQLPGGGQIGRRVEGDAAAGDPAGWSALLEQEFVAGGREGRERGQVIGEKLMAAGEERIVLRLAAEEQPQPGPAVIPHGRMAGRRQAGRSSRLALDRHLPGQQGRGRLLEVAVAVPRVGLEMRALGPFVPGVDEHELPLGGLLPLHPLDRAPQPAAVELGRGVCPDGGPLHPPGGVVPARHQAAEERVGLGGPGQRVAHRLAVVEHAAAKLRIDALEAGIGHVRDRRLERRKLDRRVEAVGPGIGAVEAVEAGEVEAGQPLGFGDPPPAVGRGGGLAEQARPVDRYQRPAFDLDVPRVAERRQQIPQKPLVAFGGMPLGEQHLLLQAVPGAGPVFVGPADAEGEVGPAAGEQPLHRLLQDPPAVEPVVVEAEAVDAVAAGHLGLPLEHALIVEVVVADVEVGHMGLVVAFEHRPAAADVGPLGEALAPPLVVFLHAMELRQVDRDRPDIAPIHGPGLRRPRRGGRGRRPGCRGVPRPRIAADEPAAVFEEVGQRLMARRGHVWMRGQVACHAELRMRRAAFPPTLREVMQQWLAARRGHVGILGQVPGGIEERAGLPALPPAVSHIVLERLEPGGPHVGVVFQIPGGVEELPRRVLLPPAAVAVIGPRPPADRPLVLAIRGDIPGLVEVETQVGLDWIRHCGARDRRCPGVGTFREGGGSTAPGRAASR